jgi:hypothetical protein
MDTGVIYAKDGALNISFRSASQLLPSGEAGCLTFINRPQMAQALSVFLENAASHKLVKIPKNPVALASQKIQMEEGLGRPLHEWIWRAMSTSLGHTWANKSSTLTYVRTGEGYVLAVSEYKTKSS